MQLSRMARSTLRPLAFATDIDAFRQRCGGQFTGTYHCPIIGGARIVFDAGTGECVGEDGVVLDQPHLVAELLVLCDALRAGMVPGGQGTDDRCEGASPQKLAGEPVSAASSVGESDMRREAAGCGASQAAQQDAGARTGTVPEGDGVPLAIDGVLIRAAQGPCHLRIIDVRHPRLPLWRQVNLLADIFCMNERLMPHVRPLPHDPTSALKSEGQYQRWLKTWKRAGVVGVLMKRAEYQPCAPDGLRDACLVRP